MKIRVKLANKKKDSDNMRLPLILLLVIVGGLVSARMMREMRANHAAHQLTVEERNLTQELQQLNRDITDLEGRFRGLINRGVMNKNLATLGVKMDDISDHQVIEVRVADSGLGNQPEGSAQR